MQKNIIVEGLDRCGKDTQIGLLSKYFYTQHNKITQVFHYSKLPFDTVEQHQSYSHDLYKDMFDMMIDNPSSYRNLIFNRAHLGEAVYAPLYRNYSGDYVFDIEKNYINELENLYMIVLVNDADILFSRDDGHGFSKNSHDIDKEKQRFERAFELSNIRKKILINCGNDSIQTIHDKIIDFIND